MITLPTPWPALAAALICAGAGFAGGYALKDLLADGDIARAQAAVADCQRARERETRAAAEAAAQLMGRARDAEADAARALARRESEFQARLKEVRREIYRLSSGRECLSPGLRLRLNAAIAADDGLPPGAAAAPAAPSGAAADPDRLLAPSGRGAGGEGTSDAGISQWILDAAQLYEQCRARLDAIRQWDEVTHGR